MRWLTLLLPVALVGCSSLIPGITGPSCSVDTASGCSCTSGGMANSFQCDESTFTHVVCCATTGWPNSGSCLCDPAPLPTCTQHSDAGCECFNGNTADAGDTVVTSCSSNGITSCCIDANQHCVCDATCTGSANPVATCGSSPVPDCGSKVHLSSCSP